MALSIIEDLESGKEFERIKQNFTPTPPDPDALANLAETHSAFEDLQSELHDFLAQYMDKVVGLQARIATSLTTTISHNSDAQRTVIPTTNSRMSHHSSADAQNGIDDGLSDRRISIKPPLKVENIPLDAHLHNLQTFLNAQMENIRRLHDASHSSIPYKDKEERATGEERSDKPLEGPDINVDFNVTLAIFVFMAALIVVFLLLVITIIGTKHRTPFSVAMFFSFLSLAALFIGMFTVRQGLVGTAEKRNRQDLNFYLQLLDQLQFMAIVLFIISIIITMFIIFTSLAFPFVVLFLSGLGALVAFSSIHWEVSITVQNIQYLAKNLRRLSSAVEYVKYNRKTTTAASLF